MLKYKRREMYTMEHYIDPETAAHNIASKAEASERRRIIHFKTGIAICRIGEKIF